MTPQPLSSTSSCVQPLPSKGPTPGVAKRLDVFAKDFVIASTSKNGLGAYATRDIKRGTRILVEAPLVEWTIGCGETVTTAGIDTLVNALNQTDRGDYFGLCQNSMHGPVKTFYGVWLSNAYPTDSPLQAARDKLSGIHRDEKRGAVFAGACRFNHACNPNAHAAWNARLGKQTIHALRDIRKNEEVTVSYLADVGTPSHRRCQQLLDDFGFTCVCATCNLTGSALAQSNTRRARIGALARLVEVAVNGGVAGTGNALTVTAVGRKRTNAIALVEERIALMEEEGTDGTSWDTLYAACAYCRSIGDKVEASKWASRAADMARLALGKDSDEFQQYAAYIGRRSATKSAKGK